MDVFKLFGMIGLNVDPYIDGLHDAERETEKVGRSLGGKFRERLKLTEDQLKAVGNAAKNLGNILTIGLTAPLAALAATGIKSAMQLETFAATLEVLIGDAERANQVFDDLYEFSAQVPFDWRTISEATRILAAYGTEAEAIVPTLDMLGDVAAGTGSDLMEVAEIYGRMQLTGRVTMLELNRLAQRGVPVIQELAKQYGVAEGAVQDLVSSGRVGFPQIRQMMIDLTSEGGRFAGMMDAQMATTAGRIAFLKDTFEQVTDAIGERLLPTVQALVAWLQHGVDWFNALTDEQKDVVIVVGAVVAALGPALAILGRLILALPELRKQIAAVRAMMVSALGPLLLLAAAAGTLYLAWRNNWFGIRDVVQAVVGWLGDAINTAIRFGASFVRNWELVQFAAVGIWEAMGSAAQYAGMLIVGGFEASIAAVKGAFEVMGASIQKVFTEAVNGIIRNINWLVDQGSGLLEFLGINVTRIAELESESWEDVTGRMATATAAAMQRIEHGQSGIARSFRQTRTLVETTIGTIIDGMDDAADATENLNEAFKVPALPDFVSNVEDLTEGLGSVAEEVEAVADALDRLAMIEAEVGGPGAGMSTGFSMGALRYRLRAVAARRWAAYLEFVQDAERVMEMVEQEVAGPGAGMAGGLSAGAVRARLRARLRARAAAANEKALAAYEAYLLFVGALDDGIDEVLSGAERVAAMIDAEVAGPGAGMAGGLSAGAVRHRLVLVRQRAEAEAQAVFDAYLAEVQDDSRVQQMVDAEVAGPGAGMENPYSPEALRFRLRTIAEAARAEAQAVFDAYLAMMQDPDRIAAMEAAEVGGPDMGSPLSSGAVAARLRAARARQQEQADAEEAERERERQAERDAALAQELAAQQAADAKRAAIIDGFTGRLKDATASAVPAFGAALEGFATGGPLGALTSMLGELLTGSDAFKSILEAANRVFEPLISALEKILSALQPLIDVVLALVDGALQPLIVILERVVAPVFTFVARIVAGIWNAIARTLNAILGWAGVKLQLIDLDGGSAKPDEGMTDPFDPFEEPEEQSFHRTSQSVQLAVATPLVEASYMMLEAATMQRDLFAGLTAAGPGMGFDALPPFTAALERATPVLDRLATEGVRIELAGVTPPPLTSATTGAFR